MGEVFAGPGFRICSRAGCKWPAVATLGFDYNLRKAWLDDLKAGPDPATYDLCSVHADRFSAPSGWEGDDRRGPDSEKEILENIKLKTSKAPRPVPKKQVEAPEVQETAGAEAAAGAPNG